MSLPSSFVRVEWSAALWPDDPYDRRTRQRNFDDPATAARQVAGILAWPTHAELLGVWRTTTGDQPINWTRVDPDELLDEYLAEDARDHYEAFAHLVAEWARPWRRDHDHGREAGRQLADQRS